MRISSRGQYALAAMIEIARQTRAGELAPVIGISETLGISKQFLEQTITLLRKGDMIRATKGAKGGYQLTKDPQGITVKDVLEQVETSLLEKMDSTVLEQAPATESALRTMVFEKLDHAIEGCLQDITIQQLLDYTDQQNDAQSFMIFM